MSVTVQDPKPPQYGMIHPDFEALVHKIVRHVDAEELGELRKDFHTRLRITLTQPDNSELVEDLWDFFYDWCVFEKQLPEKIEALTLEERHKWHHVNGANTRSLFQVARVSAAGLKVKDLYTSKSYFVPKNSATDFLGISRTDLIEGRLLASEDNPKAGYSFVRRPSYHPPDVHGYIKKKVKEFRKSQDYTIYQSWLWLLAGMYLKHRIYPQMPIDKIYDDNSRI